MVIKWCHSFSSFHFEKKKKLNPEVFDNGNLMVSQFLQLLFSFQKIRFQMTSSTNQSVCLVKRLLAGTTTHS